MIKRDGGRTLPSAVRINEVERDIASASLVRECGRGRGPNMVENPFMEIELSSGKEAMVRPPR